MAETISKGYGLLGFVPGSGNLGDEIQSLAARAFLPRVDRVLNREAMHEDPGQDLKVLLNGWFTHQPGTWPPHPRIEALPISMHLDITPRRRLGWPLASNGQIVARRGRDYLSRFGPVGTRDAASLEVLRRHGVEAYYSGCLTLTLAPLANQRTDEVIACEVSPAGQGVVHEGLTVELIE